MQCEILQADSDRIGDFRNVFKFHAYFVNKRLFLTTAKLVRGFSDVATTNVCKVDTSNRTHIERSRWMKWLITGLRQKKYPLIWIHYESPLLNKQPLFIIMVIFIPRYIGIDSIIIKTVLFLAVKKLIWTLSYRSDIKVDHLFLLSPHTPWKSWSDCKLLLSELSPLHNQIYLYLVYSSPLLVAAGLPYIDGVLHGLREWIIAWGNSNYLLHALWFCQIVDTPSTVSQRQSEAWSKYSQLCLSQICISQIKSNNKVEGCFQSSFHYFLLFLTPHKSNFLKVKAISSVPMDST